MVICFTSGSTAPDAGGWVQIWPCQNYSQLPVSDIISLITKKQIIPD